MQEALILVAAIIIWLVLRLLWITWRLTKHPHMETVDIARPSIAPFIHSMVEKISQAASITPPPIYILRSQLPNAFIFFPFKSRLILTDELLEEADQKADGVTFLEKIICHEIAHIALKHGARLLSLKLLEELVPATLFKKCGEAWLSRIEDEADVFAENIFNQLNKA